MSESGPRRDRSEILSERGQSTLIGVVLLIGMVVVGSLGIFLVGGEAISSAEQQSEQERIEQAFIELGHSISTVTTTGDVSQTLNLHAGEHGAVAHHDSAEYKIWSEDYNGENTTHIANGSIGTIEYESSDGTKVAYEGGGVFRETGERTQMLSAPAINYDHQTYTLSFPVVELTENKTLRSGDIQIDQDSASSGSMNYVENDHLFVEIESEYCLGWEQYFVDQTGNTALQQACYDDKNNDGIVKVRLGYEDISDAFSSGVSLADEDNYQEHQSGGGLDDVGGGNFKPLDETIDKMVDDFDGNETDIEDVDVSDIKNGEYFASEGSLDGVTELTFNLNDGDAIVVMQDDISGYDITVNSCGADGTNHAKIYTTGDLDVGNNEFNQNCGDDESNLQILGNSEMGVDFGNGYMEGLLYAASDKDPSGDFDGWSVNGEDENYQIHVQGSPEFDGSIIAHSITEKSNFKNFNTYSMEGSDIDVIPPGYEPAPQLTYLNIAHHEIDIKNN